MSKGSLKRAVRIVEGLSREAARRGYQVTPISSTRLGDGQIKVAIEGIGYSMRIRELSEAGAPPLDYQERYRGKLPAWQVARQRVFLPTGRLEISLGSGRPGRRTRFGDTATKTLEGQLPALLWELEVRALDDVWERASCQASASDLGASHV